MEILSSQSAIYNISVRKARFIYNLLARRGCTKRVQRNTGRYLIFCILVLSLLLYSTGSGITFITFTTFTLLLGWRDRDFLYWKVTERVGRAVGITFITESYFVGNQDFVKVSCLYYGCRYSHHLPVAEGRFLGRREEGGELVLILFWPRAGGRSHAPGVFGYRHGSDGSGLLLEISRTTGGWSARGMREVAAASGGSAPTSIATSGNAVSGAVNDTELASFKGSVICQSLLRARQGDPEK